MNKDEIRKVYLCVVLMFSLLTLSRHVATGSENAPLVPSDAVQHHGLVPKVLRSGDGKRNPPRVVVTVHHTGWTTDGRAFDSSHQRGEPTQLFRQTSRLSDGQRVHS